MRRRRLIITLPSGAYRLLEQLAQREERPTERQASFLLRRALEGTDEDPSRPAQEHRLEAR